MEASSTSSERIELQASDLFEDVPTSQFEHEEEEATRMYVAPALQAGALHEATEVLRVRPVASESETSLGGWDASTTASASSFVVASKPAFRAPVKRFKFNALYAGVMGVAVLVTGSGAIFAASWLGEKPVVTARPELPIAATAAPILVAPAARPTIAPLAAVTQPAVAQPEIASVETLYAAMHADKGVHPATAKVATQKPAVKHSAVVAAKAAKAPKPVRAPAEAGGDAPVKPVAVKAPTAVRPVKASELDDAL